MTHPATAQILRWFSYAHLHGRARDISIGFHDLALALVEELPEGGPELTVGLRKLLEAKDCAVRAAIDQERAPSRAMGEMIRKQQADALAAGGEPEVIRVSQFG